MTESPSVVELLHRRPGNGHVDGVTRFWSSVAKAGPDECWTWLRSTNHKGYGQMSIGDRMLRTHRISYELHFGPIPDGLVVMHSCDNPPCVNPAHLSIGTTADNARDRSVKGRSYRGGHNGIHYLTNRPGCRKGHEWTPENTRWAVSKERDGNPHRICRQCSADQCRAYRERKRGES